MVETRVNIRGKAKRGDIAVITVTRRDYIIGQEVTPRGASRAARRCALNR